VKIPSYARLPKAVIPIYGTTLADTLGYTLMIPLLPTLVHEYHASDLMAGAMLSVPALMSAIAAPVWGKVSDHIGRKPVIIVAQVLSLIGYLMLALSHNLGLIFLSRVISGCGGGSLGAVESFIADVTQKEQREFAYSIYGAVFGLAFVLGPAASGALMHRGLAIPFFLAAALEAADIVFTWFFVPGKTRENRQKTSIRKTLHAANEPGVRIVLIRQFLFIFAVVTFLANFSLFVDRMMHISVSHAAYLLAVAGAVGGISLLVVVTPLAKRVGDLWTTQIGLLAGIVAYVLLIFSWKPWIFIVAMIVWSVGAAAAEPSLTTLLTKRAKKEERGAIMGLSDSVNSAAMIAGPATGAAILGANVHLLPVLPGLSLAAAVLLGLRSGKRASDRPAQPDGGREARA
jgi:DHA1 family tetracycline resistance protein-like MFS transporter